MVISTIAKSRVETFFVCDGCRIYVPDIVYPIDMLYLLLKEMDVILDMNWLSINHVLLDVKKIFFIFAISN